VRVPQIDLIDQTWIAASPAVVAAAVHDDRRWPGWWPDLNVRVDERRGLEGVRWLVAPSRANACAGSMEVWLQAMFEGVVLHYFLRLDPVGVGALPHRAAARARRAHALRAKANFWMLKDELEGTRTGGGADSMAGAR
jgi:hypothetical protein